MNFKKVITFGFLFTLIIGATVGIYLIQRPREIHPGEASSQSTVLNFPTDHGLHPSFNAEWWYLNLLTKTTKADGTDQRDLAYILSFSRILGSNNLLSSKYDNTSKSFEESTEQAGSLVVRLMDDKRLFVQFSKGLISTTLEELATGSDRKKVYHLTGRTANMGSFDLTLKERTVVSSGFNTPLLWGETTDNCQGRISVFAPDDTYYYSIPDLDITGSITDIDGTRRNVLIGKAWIDHQWFNSSPPSGWRGHYWTNFHFTNSSNLYGPEPHQAFGFVTQIYSDGLRYTYWVKRNADGTNECGTNGTVVVKSYGSNNYPNSWAVNNGFLSANGFSFSDNQILQPPIGPKFIEPASYYSGNLNGTPFTGLGFFETHLIRSSATPTLTSTPIPTVLPTATPIPPECINNKDCDDSNLCTTDTCISDSCEYAPISCNEHAECNPSTGNCQCSSDNWGNCDNNNWDNGCEASLTDKANCRTCGRQCGGDEICQDKECVKVGEYPTCLITEMAETLGINTNYISIIENTDVEWPNPCLGCPEPNENCLTVMTAGKKLTLRSLYPNSSDKCWQYEYHTAGSANDLAIHCDHYRLCQEQEIDCPQCLANVDFNGDGKVDEFDYGILIDHLKDEGIPGEIIGDANNDGVVDEFDYGILIARFGEGE